MHFTNHKQYNNRNYRPAITSLVVTVKLQSAQIRNLWPLHRLVLSFKLSLA